MWGARCPQDIASENSTLSLACVNTPDAIKSLEQRPDIVLMDPFGHHADVDPEKVRSWFDTLRTHNFQIFSGVFVIVPEEIRRHDRLSIMALGADQVVGWPLDRREIEIKAKGPMDKLHLEQALFFQDRFP